MSKTGSKKSILSRFKPAKNWYINGIGAVGYLISAYAFTIALCYIIIAVIELSSTGSLQPSTRPVSSQPTYGDQSPALNIVGYLITGVVVIVSAVVLVALPYIVGRYLSSLVHYLMRVLRINQTNKDLLLLKIVLIALSLAVLVIVNLFDIVDPIIQSALLIAQLMAVAIASGLFYLQHWLARHDKRTINLIW